MTLYIILMSFSHSVFFGTDYFLFVSFLYISICCTLI